MVGQQRSARRRHEGRQAPQQRQGIEEQRHGAVAPGPAKLIQELPTRALRESLQGQGRAQNVAADPLQLIPPPRRHRHIRVQAEPFQASRAPSGRDRVGRRPCPSPKPCPARSMDVRSRLKARASGDWYEAGGVRVLWPSALPGGTRFSGRYRERARRKNGTGWRGPVAGKTGRCWTTPRVGRSGDADHRLRGSG